jgi:VanZ family protein
VTGGDLSVVKAAWWRNPVLFSYWLPPVLWCAGVLMFSGEWGSSRNTLGLVGWLLSWISSFSLGRLMEINTFLRKVGHVLAYGILYFLWFRAFQGNLYYSAKKSFLWALGLSLLVALVDEGHQSLYRTRGGSFTDVGLDFSASLLASLLTAIVWPIRSRPGPAAGKLASGQPADS